MPSSTVQHRMLARPLAFALVLAAALAVSSRAHAQLMDADDSSSNPAVAQQSLNSGGVSGGQVLTSLAPSTGASTTDSSGVFLSESSSAPTTRSTSHIEDVRIGGTSPALVAQDQALVLPVPEWSTAAMAGCALLLLGFVAAANRAGRRQTPAA